LKSLKLEEQPHPFCAFPVIAGEFHPNLSFQTVKLFSVTFVPLLLFFGTRLRPAQQAKSNDKQSSFTTRQANRSDRSLPVSNQLFPGNSKGPFRPPFFFPLI
jgi:hypothetical protein